MLFEILQNQVKLSALQSAAPSFESSGFPIIRESRQECTLKHDPFPCLSDMGG